MKELPAWEDIAEAVKIWPNRIAVTLMNGEVVEMTEAEFVDIVAKAFTP
jgi:hypothetical protein